jgi:hypothetical protein
VAYRRLVSNGLNTYLILVKYLIHDPCLSNVNFLLQVLYSYSIGFAYILVGLVISGTLIPASDFCKQVSIIQSIFKYTYIFRSC